MSTRTFQAHAARQSILSPLLKKCRKIRPRSLAYRIRSLYCAADVIDPTLFDGPAINALPVLAQVPWRRPLYTWETPGWDGLVQHLLISVKYPINPALIWAPVHSVGRHLYSRFNREATRAIQTLAHIGGGGSVRDARRLGMLPRCLTRRMDHVLLTLEGELSLTEAVRTAQVQVLGGPRPLAHQLTQTILRSLHDDETEAWWQEILNWLCQQPTVQDHHIRGMVDWMAHQRQHNGDVLSTDRAKLRRRLTSLKLSQALHASQRWHERHVRPTARVGGPLPGCGVEGLEHEDSAGKWTLEEIREGAALAAEGVALRHCVASYAPRIRQGTSAIFSLRLDGARRLTVELRPETRQIVQARGFCNRAPRPEERAILDAWAQRAGLEVRSV